jgi:hypothetical protein
MKKTLIAIACAVALASNARTASALTIGDAFYVGNIIDGIPSSLADEAAYINALITLLPDAPNIAIGTETYNRVGSTLASPLPSATDVGAVKTDTSVNTGIDVSGFTYLLGKYDASDAGSFVWLVSGLTTVDLPALANERELSHYSLFNPTSVPDGGTTIGLLGLAMLALGYLRYRTA